MEAVTGSRAATSLVAASTFPHLEDPCMPSPASTRWDDVGATLVEYGLLVALIALAAFAAVTAFGIEVNGLIDQPELVDALR